MGRQTKSKKQDGYGKGKVTAVQIAFIVDRYLSDNNYTQSRSAFRNEASHLISKSPVQEAPRTLLSLAAILDEYISLKEQKVMLDQEKSRVESEKFRVQTLLRGMQDAMTAYNAGGAAPPPPSLISSAAAKSGALVLQTDYRNASLAGNPVRNSSSVIRSSRFFNSQTDPSSSTPSTTHSSAKRRKGSKDVADGPQTAKRSRGLLPSNNPPLEGTNTTLVQSRNSVNDQGNPMSSSAGQSSPHENVQQPPVQGSGVAKCLFSQPSPFQPTNTSVPKTPPRATSSQTEKSVSPVETCSTATTSTYMTPQQQISTDRIVISSERVQVSPAKQMTYYSIERNRCISSPSPAKNNLTRFNRRDQVKGRLDFDGSEAVPNFVQPNHDDGSPVSNSDKEVEMFDLDLPNLDAFGMDFSSFSDLLEFDFNGDFSYQATMDSSPNTDSGSPQQICDVDAGIDQIISELSSTVTEIRTEKETNMQGPESVTSLRSTTKCITVLSPVKNHRRASPGHENMST